MAVAFASEEVWRDQIRAAAYAIFDLVAEDRRFARFLFVDTLAAGERVTLLREEGLVAFSQVIDLGRNELEDPDSVSSTTAVAIAGTVYNQIRVAIQADALTEDLVPKLLYNVVLPYLGSEAAEEELRLPRDPGQPTGGIYPAFVAEEELGPLPAGRHGLTREQVVLNQRERLIGGLAEAVAEHGYNAVTITHITKAAQVSRRAFYENFENKEDCFLAAFEIVVSHLRDLVTEAVEPIDDWPHEVIAAFRALLGFLAKEPDLARLCLVESLTAGPVVAERFRQTIYGFIPLLERGRQERHSDRPLPDSTESSLIGALASMASRSILAGDAAHLDRLLPDWVDFVLTPYLGPDEARRLAEEAG